MEPDAESSSLGLSDLEASVEALQIGGVIDGALLEKLGVPLDYNEQQQLATMITENRKMQTDNEQRFAGDEEDTEDNIEDTETEQPTEDTETEAAPGPDDVKCENCGK